MQSPSMSSGPNSKKTILHQSSPTRDTKLMSDFRLPVEMDALQKLPRHQHGRASQSPGKRPHLRRQSMSSKSLASSMASDRRSNTAVYVKDSVYVWLPAQILSSTEERAMVKIVIPDDWAKTTILGEKSSITALEYETTSGGFGSYMSPKFGQSEVGKGGDQKRKCYSYERDHLEYDESKPAGIQRTLSLRDYPNSELPLQNTDRHAQRLLSMKSHELKNTICHPLVNARDMADLHFLHEAAILYNLKQRHAQNLPYTRVGDIVVAVNPFEWIDGLYSSEKQGLYAKHLIWDAKDYEIDEKIDESQQDDVSDLGNISDVAGSDMNDSFRDAGGMAPLTPKGKTISFQKKYSEAKGRNDPPPERHEPMAHGSIYSRLGLEPHVYESASLAYRDLASNRDNQTILVSGESGAGKTETVKIVMTILATIEQTRPSYRSPSKGLFQQNASGDQMNSVVKKVLESNPVFEAFGCAKTVRNDNSSRFGRFTQLQYEVERRRDAEMNSRVVLPSCLLRGSFCATYLLEKSRVVGHAQGERNYHIFYQLLSAPDNEKALIWDDLISCGSDSFAYIGNPTTATIEGNSDSESWGATVKSLKSFGFAGESFRHLMRALCVVLQLGNLTFSTALPSFEEGSTISSPGALAKLSKLIGIPEQNIAKAMTTRVSKIRGEEVTARPNPKDAKEGCDALAKTIYASIFDTLVKQINGNTSVAPEHGSNGTIGTISLLDIFGFERFEVNRFEQLCINFSNERLQHRYVLDNFRAVKEEYTAEGIEIFDFSMVDNSGVLELLEGKLGLITSLNEECVRPQGKASSFVYKLKMLHNDSKHLLVDRLQRQCEFGIKHFAGAVTYDASEFLKSNADLTPKDLLLCASRSSNPLIQRELEGLIASTSSGGKGPPRRATARTVMAKFRSQLNVLMNSIEKTKSRYIRCIKPNTEMSPRQLNHRETMNQLESAGLVTAITISRETFPNRLPYDVIWERFQCLNKRDSFITPRCNDPTDENLKNDVESLLKSLLLKSFTRADGARVPSYCCGNTRVYFRTGALEQLESDRMQYYSLFASKIGNWYRCRIVQLKFKRFRNMVINVQALGRKIIIMKRFRVIRNAAIVIQKVRRMLQVRRKYINARESAIKVQGAWRRFRTRKFYIKSLRSIVLLQSLLRAVVARRRYCTLNNCSVIVQSFWRGCSARIMVFRLVQDRAVETARKRQEATIKIQAWFRCQSLYGQYKADAKSDKGKFVDDDDGNDNVSPSLSSHQHALVSCDSSRQTNDPSVKHNRRDILDSLKIVEMEIMKEHVSKLKEENRDLMVEVEIRGHHIKEMKEKLGSIEHENQGQTNVFKSDLRSAEDRIQSLQDESLQFDTQKKEYETSIDMMESQEGLLQRQISMMEEDKVDVQAKFDELQDNIASLERNRTEHQDLVKNLRSSASSMEKDLEEREAKLDELQQVVTSLEDDIEMRDKIASDLKRRLTSLETENEEMDSELKASYKEINTIHCHIEYLEKEADEMNLELEARIEEGSVLKSSVDALEIEADGLNSELATSFSEINSLKAQILSLLKQNEDRDQRNKVLQVQILSLEDSIVELNNNLDASEARCVSLTQELSGCKSNLARRVEQVTSLEEIINSKDHEASSITDKVVSLEEVISIRDREIADLHDKIASLDYTIEERNQAAIVVQNEVTSLKDTLATRDSVVGDLGNQVDSLGRELSSIQHKAASLEETVASQKAVIICLEEEMTCRDDIISGFKKQVNVFDRNIQEHSDQTNTLQDRIASLEVENRETSSELERQISEDIKIRENVVSLEEKLRDRDDKLAIIQILNETLENTINTLKGKGKDLTNQLDYLLLEKKVLQDKLGKSTEESAQLTEEGATLKSQNKALKAEVSSLRDEIDSLRTTVSTFEGESFAGQNKISMLDAQVTSLEKNISTQTIECDDLKSQISSLVDEKKEIILKTSCYENSLQECKAEVEELRTQLDSRDALASSIDDELNTLKQDLAFHNDEILRQRAQLSLLEKEKEEASSTSKRQEVALKHKIGRLEKSAEMHGVEMQRLKSQLEVSVRKYEEVLRNSSELKAREKEEQKEILLLHELVGTLKQTINEYNDQALELTGEIESLNIANESLQQSNAEEVNTLKQTIDDYNDQALEFTAEIEHLKLTNESLQQSHSEQASARETHFLENPGLKEQLKSMQTQNEIMKEEFSSLENTKAELVNKIQSLVTASKSATNRSQSLLQTNKTLLAQISKLKLENAKIRRNLIEGDQGERALPPPKAQCDRIVHDRESEIIVLREALADSMRGRELFAKSVEEKMEREREAMLSEIHCLKEKFQRAKDTSDDYKQKIIDVLETSYSTREAQIRKLKKEIKRLNDESRKSNVASANSLSTMTKQRRMEHAEGHFQINQRDRHQKVLKISNLVQKHKLDKNQRGNDLFNQIINSMEDFCKSEEQQRTEVPTKPTTGEGWAPYPPQI